MKDFLNHTKTYIFRGLLAIIPLALSWFVLQIIYIWIDKRVTNLIDQYIGIRIPGLGILLILIGLYFIGLLVSNVIGRRLFSLIEMVLNRIPILKTTYQIGKQLSSTFSLSEKQVFKQAVLVDYLKSGVFILGFVTGTIVDKRNKEEKLLKVFIPTVPNPTTGFVIVVRQAQILDPKWPVEEAMRAVISGGIIGPDKIE